MYSHLESDIYHLKSCICLTAESRQLIAHYCAPRSRVPAALAQNDKAAAMAEPTASLGGSSRASRMAVALFQRLLPSFPPVIAAALLQIDLMPSTINGLYQKSQMSETLHCHT